LQLLDAVLGFDRSSVGGWGDEVIHRCFSCGERGCLRCGGGLEEPGRGHGRFEDNIGGLDALKAGDGLRRAGGRFGHCRIADNGHADVRPQLGRFGQGGEDVLDQRRIVDDQLGRGRRLPAGQGFKARLRPDAHVIAHRRVAGGMIKKTGQVVELAVADGPLQGGGGEGVLPQPVGHVADRPFGHQDGATAAAAVRRADGRRGRSESFRGRRFRFAQQRFPFFLGLFRDAFVVLVTFLYRVGRGRFRPGRGG